MRTRLSQMVGLGAYMSKDVWNNKGTEGTCV
ncbi:hypothetical protein K413DRAFT_4574 [Clostridium sp. ASBs410]|jgi:hypothetical protein|nr:hypothetical protein K413DRAFT_4574 [Clostridium sp. ASBs410]